MDVKAAEASQIITTGSFFCSKYADDTLLQRLCLNVLSPRTGTGAREGTAADIGAFILSMDCWGISWHSHIGTTWLPKSGKGSPNCCESARPARHAKSQHSAATRRTLRETVKLSDVASKPVNSEKTPKTSNLGRPGDTCRIFSMKGPALDDPPGLLERCFRRASLVDAALRSNDGRFFALVGVAWIQNLQGTAGKGHLHRNPAACSNTKVL